MRFGWGRHVLRYIAHHSRLRQYASCVRGDFMKSGRRARVDCYGCGWSAARLAGSAKPCPRCGAPVSTRPSKAPRARGQLSPCTVYLSAEERAELVAMSGEGIGEAIRQVVCGVLDVRRMRRLSE